MEKYCNGINQKSIDLLLDVNKEDKRLSKAYRSIDSFTQINATDSKQLEVYDCSFNYKIDLFEYSADDILIRFKRLSDVIRAIWYKNELLSVNRHFDVIRKTYQLCPYIDDSKLLTGYTFIDGKKELHSVIECADGIVDWDLNAIIQKKDYFKLTKFQVISELSVDKIKEDQENRVMEELRNDPTLLNFYILFRDELMADLEKNKQITKKQTIF